MTSPKPQKIIGTLQERSLHAKLKEIYKQPGDQLEVSVGKFVIDIVRDDLLIEIQTRNFSAIKNKLMQLLKDHKVLLVYPIPKEKWIVRETPDGSSVISRRKSPKRLDFIDVFRELVRIPRILRHSNFSLELVLIKEEQVLCKDGKGSWRRKGWSVIDRKLVEIIDRKLFSAPSELLDILPKDIPNQFTNKDLAELANITRNLAQKVTYCLRQLGVIELQGKQGRSHLFKIV
ncbi:MAG: hypothetical protein ACTSUO_09530 [Candidatus Thorarchaeota archaeon]